MATNDFLPFAAAAGANVVSQDDYAKLAALANGFSSGVAKSDELNKVWRQASIISAVLAQFIIDETGENAVDDGTTSALLANLKTAVSGRLLNVQFFSASGTYTPTPGTKSIIVEAVGASGGSGGLAATSSTTTGCSTPSAQGSYAMARYTSGFSSGVGITCGSGGQPGSSTSSGGLGGDTQFGSLLTCPGGGGSPAGGVSSGGVSGRQPDGAKSPYGYGIISSIYGIIPPNAIQSATQIATNFTASEAVVMPGSMAGLSVGGIWSDYSKDAQPGTKGAGGAVRIWEYS